MIVHLLELRRRLIQIAVLFVTLFLICYGFSADVMRYLLSPLLTYLPAQVGLIATDLTTPLLLPLTLSADLTVLGCAPLCLFHLWRFVAPGLYRGEQAALRATITLSILLFCVGILFCFYLVLPYILQCFINATPKGVQFMPEITSSLHFILRMLLLFGLCFQVPLVCVLLVKTGLVTTKTLKNGRRYWVVMAFILGMLLTPPDVLSQVTLAVPLCLLYEVGIFLSRPWLSSIFCRRTIG
jgi:sec-independent protein translocase protein TatC